MSTENFAEDVRYLRDRQQILDCLMRYSRGIDRLDREILLSAYHPDAIDDHGSFVATPTEFADYVLELHRQKHLTHQHALFNHTCDLEGDVAHTETYYMFVALNRTGQVFNLNGGRYLDRLEKRNGEWKIATRLCLRDWAMLNERPEAGDLAAYGAGRNMISPEVRAFFNAGIGPQRDRTDPSYLRPLVVSDDRVRDWRSLRTSQGGDS